MNKYLRLAFCAVILTELIGWFELPLAASDFTWFGLVITAAFVWAILEIFHVPWYVCALALAATIIDGVSALWTLYSRIDSWDRWIHGLGGLVIGAGALHLILQGLRKGHVSVKRIRPFIIMGTYLIVAGIGFLYEFWEYLVDHIQYGYPKSLVNAYDSVEDQVFNLLGATLVILFYVIRQRKSKNEERLP